MAIPTALTVQSTRKVHRVLPAFPNTVDEQLRVLAEDIVPDAIKIGMLATDDIVLRLAPALARLPVPRVVDPVLRASDGTWLLERRAHGNLLQGIVAGAALVTPNLDEAELLVGTRDPEAAARALLELGAEAALVKGGHADGPPDDFLLTRSSARWIRAERRHPEPVHGTGCALSSAIAARLARGESLERAAPAAKLWLESALAGAIAFGAGRRLLRLDPA